jgi:hypothetical protein
LISVNMIPSPKDAEPAFLTCLQEPTPMTVSESESENGESNC